MSKYSKPNLHASFYESVAAYDSEQHDTVVPSGETWTVLEFVGSAAYVATTTVRLVWDPDGTPIVLATTHGDTRIVLEEEITGDGSKKLSIVLLNDTGSSQDLGGQWGAQRAI